MSKRGSWTLIAVVGIAGAGLFLGGGTWVWNRLLELHGVRRVHRAAEVTIPFDLASRHIVLSLSVNGSRPLSFVLDTGDKLALMDLDRARELGVKLGEPVHVGGVGS